MKERKKDENKIEERGIKEREIYIGEVDYNKVESSNRFEDWIKGENYPYFYYIVETIFSYENYATTAFDALW